MGVVLTFLYHVPDRARAECELDRLIGGLFCGACCRCKCHGLCPQTARLGTNTPEHPLRKYFREEDIAANLDAIVAGQQADGGWNITWQAVSPGCELEWRGWVTLGTLLTLRANGRLRL